jgi:hypothetical protein
MDEVTRIDQARAWSDRDTAYTLISEAPDTAGRLGVDGNHRFTAFGPTGVSLYRISIARMLGNSGAAIEAARQINTTLCLRHTY